MFRRLLPVCRPYLLLVAVACIAWWPVVCGLASLKNDAINLDLPINYFMSEAIHHGFAPTWINTWAGGFPLQSALGWSMYNPLQLLLSTLFHYNVYTLHFEFLLYVVLAGVGMLELLKVGAPASREWHLTFAITYMLSGFTVSSAQFLLYMSAIAFLPFMFRAFIIFLRKPGWQNDIRLVGWLYIGLTSMYPPLFILFIYAMLTATILVLFRKGQHQMRGVVAHGLICGVGLGLLAAPFLYHSTELIRMLDRGHAITDHAFSHSNYMHPAATLSLLMPMYAISIKYPNTTDVMQNMYVGIMSIIMLPFCVQMSIRRKLFVECWLLIGALFCLLCSFDQHIPLRGWLNILPGFDLFRGAAIFRLFSIIFLMQLLTRLAPEVVTRLKSIIGNFRKLWIAQLGFAIFIALGTISVVSAWPGRTLLSAKGFVYALRDQTSFSISILLLATVCAGLFLVLRRGNMRLLKWVLVADLLTGTFLCMPYLAVSSYTPSELSRKMAAVEGFPVIDQLQKNITILHDDKGNPLYNFNVYKKLPGVDTGYYGPLELNNAHAIFAQAMVADVPRLIRSSAATTITMLETLPSKITFDCVAMQPSQVTVLQNYFPGWVASVNGKPIDIQHEHVAGMGIVIPAGTSNVQLTYRKPLLVISSISINCLLYLLAFVGMITSIKVKQP
jgi:hypothetical protein